MSKTLKLNCFAFNSNTASVPFGSKSFNSNCAQINFDPPGLIKTPIKGFHNLIWSTDFFNLAASHRFVTAHEQIKLSFCTVAAHVCGINKGRGYCSCKFACHYLYYNLREQKYRFYALLDLKENKHSQ